MGFRNVKVYNDNILVAETRVTLVSDEWFLVTPLNGEIVGNRLEID